MRISSIIRWSLTLAAAGVVVLTIVTRWWVIMIFWSISEVRIGEGAVSYERTEYRGYNSPHPLHLDIERADLRGAWAHRPWVWWPSGGTGSGSIGVDSFVRTNWDVPLWMPAAALGAGAAAMWLVAARQRRRAGRGCCPACGYAMAGLPRDSTCPECGHR